MSYNSTMFHKIAEELERMASEVEKGEIDSKDVFAVLNAIGMIVANCYDDDLASSALTVATCRFGDMYELYCELPDALIFLMGELMETLDYTSISGEGYTGWIKGY